MAGGPPFGRVAGREAVLDFGTGRRSAGPAVHGAGELEKPAGEEIGGFWGKWLAHLNPYGVRIYL